MALASTVQLYDPTGELASSATRLSPRLDNIEGKVLGILDNTKPNFGLLLRNLEALLLKRYPNVKIVKKSKGSAAAGAGEALINELAKSSDALITGSGD